MAVLYFFVSTMFFTAFMGFGVIDAVMEAQGRIQISGIGSFLSLLILIRTQKEPTKQATEKEATKGGEKKPA